MKERGEFSRKQVISFQILILANRRDMGHHRQMTDDQISHWVDGFNRLVIYELHLFDRIEDSRDSTTRSICDTAFESMAE